MKVFALEGLLFESFPRSDAEEWDHVGLSVGDPSAEVSRVCCALDPTEENVRRAAALGANVLVTHHPVYLKAPNAFTPAAPDRPACAAAVYTAIGHGVSIMSFHTNLDRSLAARELLPSLMGWEATGSLEHPHQPELPGLGALCPAVSCTLGELAARVAAAFDTEPRVWGPAGKHLESVAFLGGSLGSLGELALAAGADAVVAGECGYHVAQDLAVRGCSPVLIGHDRSEEPFCALLARAVRDAGVAAEDIEVIHPARAWWTADNPTRSKRA